MLLNGKTAIVFAAGGAISAAVARKFADEGARVYLSGRSSQTVEPLATSLKARWKRVDATNEGQVVEWVDEVVGEAGRVDIVFNGIGPRAGDASYATSSFAIPYQHFQLPLLMIPGSQFLTARAAGKYMARQGSGAIVFLSASLTGSFVPFMSGITAACGAVEALSRTLATEFAQAGVRVNCVRAGGMPETRTILETTSTMGKTLGQSQEEASRAAMFNLRGRPLTVVETANMVAWVASDQASGVVGQVVNVCAGSIVSR